MSQPSLTRTPWNAILVHVLLCASCAAETDTSSLSDVDPNVSDSAASPIDATAPSTAHAAATDGVTGQVASTDDATTALGPRGFLTDAGEGWSTLITGEWELGPGQESYQCVRFTVPKDVTVGAFRSLSPVGTHHSVLTIAEAATAPDGNTACDGNTFEPRIVTSAGVGTNDFNMPDGVGTRLVAGQQLLLNVHLFNVFDRPIRGVSGTLIKLRAEQDIDHYAEDLLAGTAALKLPPGGPTVARGTCTLIADGTLFAVAPHMHQLGVHQKIVAHSSFDGDIVLHDAEYRFEEQKIYPLASQVRMKAGDTLDIECTYMNTTATTVGYGNSSLDEMCFSDVYRYPASTKFFLCIQ